MARSLTIIIGAVFGLLGGAVAGHLMLDLGSSRIEKAIGGAFVGALCGVLGGSIGGDLSGQADKLGNRNLYAVVSGAFTGALSAAQSEGLIATAWMFSHSFSLMR
jgi:hypothetical protein